MKESSDGFVRADQIDLKSLDEQLERHLNRVLTLEKNKIMRDPETNSNSINLSTSNSTTSTSAMTLSIPKRHRQDWEIDPAKLIIKSVIARGTFGTVHRGMYDGQDVAGIPPSHSCRFTLFFFFLLGSFQVSHFRDFLLKNPIFLFRFRYPFLENLIFCY